MNANGIHTIVILMQVASTSKEVFLVSAFVVLVGMVHFVLVSYLCFASCVCPVV